VEKAQASVEEIRATGNIAEAFSGDVLEKEFPQKLVQEVLKRWGKINCVINNAGKGHVKALAFSYLTEERFLFRCCNPQDDRSKV
jgi:3-oxoacyl-[acyl-carrier protein] reductase